MMEAKTIDINMNNVVAQEHRYRNKNSTRTNIFNSTSK